MKNLNKLILSALFSVVSMSSIQAQCPTSITSTGFGNGAFAFSSNGTGSNYFWDLGDGTTSAQVQINQYQYAVPGAYNVCLTIDSCPAVCDSILYVGTSSCSVIAGYTFVDNGSGNYSFTNTSTGNSLIYDWNFGDGSSSTTINPSHTYTANGTYVVALVTTSTTDSCFDYSYKTIQVSGISSSISCNAAFVIIPDSSSQQGTGSGTLVVFNTSTGSNLSYAWDFGDGNTSTQQYPNYTYATNGPFYLCLTVDDGSGCISTYCDSINSAGYIYKQIGFTINVQAPVVTGIEDNINLISEINMYPNPVKNVLTINLNLNEQTQVEVFVTDLLGKTIQSIANQNLNVGNNKLQWNTNNVSNGVYLLNIKTNNSLQVKKIVVNR